MDTVLDILTGIGLGCAAGIRPFLPGLAAGAFAAADLAIDFEGTDLSFLEGTGWLLALVIALVLLVLAQRSMGADRTETGPVGTVVLIISAGVGALLFAGALADGADVWWPGIIGGIACAVLGYRVTHELLARTRGRLDPEAAAALNLYAEGAALLIAVLSILVPPLSLVALGGLIWLLVAGRRRKGEKYAGLRILR